MTTISSNNTAGEAGKAALQHATWLLQHARILRDVATDKAERGLIVMAFNDIMAEVAKTEARAQELLKFAAEHTGSNPAEGPYR